MDVEKIQELKYELVKSVLNKQIVDLKDKSEDIHVLEEFYEVESEGISALIAMLVRMTDCLIAESLSVLEFVLWCNKIAEQEGIIETEEREIICELLKEAGGDLKAIEKIRNW